jgi:Thioredoxin
VSEFEASGIRRVINARTIPRPKFFPNLKSTLPSYLTTFYWLKEDNQAENDCSFNIIFDLNIMAHNWESVVMEYDDEGMEHYVLVSADEDIEDDFVLADTDRTVIDTNHVSPLPTDEGSMNLLDALDVVPGEFPFDEALAFLGSTKLKGIWILVCIVSIVLFHAVDFLYGIRTSQPWKPEVQHVPCPVSEEARTSEIVGKDAEVREPRVSPLWYLKVSASSQMSLNIADVDASDCNKSTLEPWEELKVPRPRISANADKSWPSIQHGSLTVWESRYQVEAVEPNIALSDKAPMIPMVRWDGTHDASEYGHVLYPSMYPSVGLQEIVNTGPVSTPRIPVRSLIPFRAPEVKVPTSDQLNDFPRKSGSFYRPELYPSLLFTERAPSNIPYIAHRDKGEKKIATSLEMVEPQGSVVLTQYTFQEFIRHHENVLVTFYLPCERFQFKFEPLWTNFTSAVLKAKLPLVMATVNCHSHPSICREQGCFKFPTIRWFRKAEVLVEDYNNGRNAEKLLLFAQEMFVGQNNTTKTHQTISYPTIQVMPPPTSHAKYGREVDEIQGHHLPSVAFVKKQRTPVISSSTATSNSLALHRVPGNSIPCPVSAGPTTSMISTPNYVGSAASYPHRMEL